MAVERSASVVQLGNYIVQLVFYAVEPSNGAVMICQLRLYAGSAIARIFACAGSISGDSLPVAYTSVTVSPVEDCSETKCKYIPGFPG